MNRKYNQIGRNEAFYKIQCESKEGILTMKIFKMSHNIHADVTEDTKECSNMTGYTM